MLFADIGGFTSMSERMSPSAVALLLNDYLSRMTDVIFKYEGTLDKYIGDAIMAVFGAPLDMPDHAERAIRTALEMQERLAEWNAERKEGPAFRVRIGINSGKAVAGEIGSVNKKEYTVLGDTVNIASRLESSVAKPGMVVVGENTYRHGRGPVRVPAAGVLHPQGQGEGGPRLRRRGPRLRGGADFPARGGGRPDAMAGDARRGRRGRILYSILALLFAVGVVPLVWTSYRLVRRQPASRWNPTRRSGSSTRPGSSRPRSRSTWTACAPR